MLDDYLGWRSQQAPKHLRSEPFLLLRDGHRLDSRNFAALQPLRAVRPLSARVALNLHRFSSELGDCPQRTRNLGIFSLLSGGWPKPTAQIKASTLWSHWSGA